MQQNASLHKRRKRPRRGDTCAAVFVSFLYVAVFVLLLYRCMIMVLTLSVCFSFFFVAFVFGTPVTLLEHPTLAAGIFYFYFVLNCQRFTICALNVYIDSFVSMYCGSIYTPYLYTLSIHPIYSPYLYTLSVHPIYTLRVCSLTV